VVPDQEFDPRRISRLDADTARAYEADIEIVKATMAL
jgi:hypothetical protein